MRNVRFVALVVVVGCGGSGAGAAAPGAKNAVDGLDELDGTKLGTPASAIADLEPVTVGSKALRRRRSTPPVAGSKPTETMYTFDESEKLSGGVWSFPRSECDKLREALTKRLGPATDRAWEGSKVRVTVLQTAEGCGVTWGRVEIFHPPKPTSSAVAKLGDVELGAKLSTFTNLKKADESMGLVYYRDDPPPALEGVKLARASYAFRDDKLQSFTFQLADPKECAALAEKLGGRFGKPKTEPNAGGGTSHRWTGATWTLRLNDFGKTCDGAMMTSKS